MATNGTSTAADQSNDNLGKDEVAWFFVEQYYTTLSKTPEKLHLFYSKQSQFVYGKEAEVANVSVGRQKIQERIKSLDFKDNTKVRVSNVDSQTSHENIVIQVIGETAFKATEDPKKFVQTFVLAKQPSGYFVLNDILRYIDDSETEEEQLVEAPAAAPLAPETEDVAAPTTEEAAPEPVAATLPVADAAPPATATASLDAGVLDQKLEEVSAEEKEATPVNGDAATEQPAEAAAAAPEAAEKTETAAKPDPEATSREVAEEDTKEPEKPTDPSPTPVATRQPAPAAAPAPAQPPKPMTWASRAAAAAAAAAGPRPAVPAAVPKTATPPASRPAAQAPPAPAAQPAAAPAPAQASEATPANAAKESTEWQTAGSDNKRHARPQSVSAPRAEKEGTLGYVKFTSEKVDPEELKSALSAHGELVYFDVNRQKSCAFIEFGSPAGYQAAVAANPHVVNGESIMVEPRRPKAGAYGGASYNTGRGGNMAGRGGRGGFDGGRSGPQGGRGNFGGQGRGRGGMPRGGARGASQAANA